MSRTERFGTRGWAWSVFHRCMPKPAYMIDLDYIECCQYCKKPLILAEIAKDVGQNFKPTRILYQLAEAANLLAWLIFYKEETVISAVKHILNTDGIKGIPILTETQLKLLWAYLKNQDEPILRLIQIHPKLEIKGEFTGREFYGFLSSIHHGHEVNCRMAMSHHPLLKAHP